MGGGCAEEDKEDEASVSGLVTVADRFRVLILDGPDDCCDGGAEPEDGLTAAAAVFLNMTAAPSELTRTRIPLFGRASFVEVEAEDKVGEGAEGRGASGAATLCIGKPRL